MDVEGNVIVDAGVVLVLVGGRVVGGSVGGLLQMVAGGVVVAGAQVVVSAKVVVATDAPAKRAQAAVVLAAISGLPAQELPCLHHH